MKLNKYVLLYFFISDVADKSQAAYQEAWDIATGAQSTLRPTNPIRLGLALNLSVFYFEMQSNREKACTLAKSVSLFLLDFFYFCGSHIPFMHD